MPPNSRVRGGAGIAAGRAMRVVAVVCVALGCGETWAQDPTSKWKPNSVSLGPHCWKDAPNPNTGPAGPGTPPSHDGGCGCENTLLRLDGHLIMMESTTHGCDVVFPGYNSTAEGDCSYFRIRNATTGMVMANVSASLRHSFFAAVADHGRRMVWVFGAAHARGNTVHPGPCDVEPYKGCYVGVWNASFDDLTAWSVGRVAVPFPDGYALFNNDVALVYGAHAPGGSGSKLPAHQAVMVFEQRTDNVHTHPFIPPFAVNVGTDGDLSKNWKLLNDSVFSFDYPKGAAGEGTAGAPTIRFDGSEGYYYSIGGGWITNGPARSRNLSHWQVSPLAPMAVPDTRAVAAGLPPSDSTAGINTAFYTELWKEGVSPTVRAWAANMSKWNWGVTDPDLCCSDGQGPSFLINCMSQQGAPATFDGKTYGFSRLRRSELPLNEWLRSFFP